MNFATNPLGSYLFERYRARLIIGLTLSLIVHAFIVSLQFGTPGLDLPGLELPWNERRAQTPELSIRIANVKSTPGPAPSAAPAAPPPEPARIEKPVDVAPATGARVTLPSQAPKPTSPEKRETPPPAAPPRPKPAPPKSRMPVISKKEASPDSFVLPSASPEEPEQEVISKTEAPYRPPEVTERTAPEAARPKPPEEPAVQAKEQAAQKLKEEEEEEEEASRAQELEAKKQEEATAKRLAAETEARTQVEEAARQQAKALALQKQAERKLEEEETAKRVQQLEAKKQEEARKQEQAKAERKAMELEARKQAEETARQQAAALDRQKQAEELAAREKAQEIANRQQAEALAAQQRERDRNAAESLTAGSSSSAGNNKAVETASLPRNLFGSGLANRAIEQARKLDLERVLPPRPAENAPRRSVFGRVDQDIGVTMYIESWRQKVERNGNMNYRPSARDRAREDPIVTVSIRSDGSVEDIAIIRSSGLPELDDAVRRIVRLYARYGAFPPDLARRYDVIEIRRVWNFDDKLRIREEMR